EQTKDGGGWSPRPRVGGWRRSGGWGEEKRGGGAVYRQRGGGGRARKSDNAPPRADSARQAARARSIAADIDRAGLRRFRRAASLRSASNPCRCHGPIRAGVETHLR